VDEATKIHIISTKDFDTGEVCNFYNDKDLSRSDKNYKGEIKDGLNHLLSYDKLVCHNLIGHDLPLINKLHPKFKDYFGIPENRYFTESERLVDTLILSRMLDPDRLKHSVDSYGEEFKVPKPKHEDWSKLSKEMIVRCEEDTKIQALIYKKLSKELEDSTWDKAIKMEHELAEVCEEMTSNRWKFDLGKALDLKLSIEKRLEEIEMLIKPLLPKRCINQGELKKVFLKSGEYNNHASKWISDNKIHIDSLPVGSFTRVKFEDLSLYSPAQIKEWLLKEGWVPDAWNLKKDRFNKFERDERGNVIKASPKITLKSLERFSERNPDKKHLVLISEFFQNKHRLSLLESKKSSGSGFIQVLDKDETIKGGIIPCGTNTARARHIGIVNIPSEGSFLGEELRSLFTARAGKVMVGWDACALEARVEAHYTYPYDKGAYANELLNGDIHTKNAKVFGVDRKTSKGGKYALTYGCSPKKLAETLNKPEEEANKLYKKFWDENNSLKSLKRDLEEVFSIRKKDFKKPYIRAIDGRKLYIRYKHALINTVFQSAGSIIVKNALVLLAKQLKIHNLDVKILGFFHDEAQAEMKSEVADIYGKLSLKCLLEAGEMFDTNVAIEGEYKKGENWGETH
jgi:hypothetical protein